MLATSNVSNKLTQSDNIFGATPKVSISTESLMLFKALCFKDKLKKG
jgi:hypothetical protein